MTIYSNSHTGKVQNFRFEGTGNRKEEKQLYLITLGIAIEPLSGIFDINIRDIAIAAALAPPFMSATAETPSGTLSPSKPFFVE
ncbi:MAG: hypothetical protein F6K22_19970 [Okeania sp. SIO2F4]|uniref:hypothetical protein n=1 Tax=Okeania sp. SIO2F4 TaxID=2607790 RepID=UPI001428E83B|nr:hypothetical protein [Okeania sp. SIO2F4]NES04912.1 hypothetical protein [Okeania sp. SIO2F4]